MVYRLSSRYDCKQRAISEGISSSHERGKESERPNGVMVVTGPSITGMSKKLGRRRQGPITRSRPGGKNEEVEWPTWPAPSEYGCTIGHFLNTSKLKGYVDKDTSIEAVRYITPDQSSQLACDTVCRPSDS